jgi:spermidine synthase
MMDLRFSLLLVCFFVSGFAALLYQTAWTREFAFLFGTSELAVVAVLAAYMGGLALGAAAAARFVGRMTRPVLAYGLLELGIALCALGVPFGIRIVQSLYLSIAGGLDAPPETMALTTAFFHLLGAFVVLVPCTALMGATLPLLARYAVSDDAQVGPRIGILYAVNTLGAIAGTLIAAFVFLPEFGLRHTVYIGVAGNALVFLAAALLARGLSGMAPEAPGSDPKDQARFHWILPAMTISGAVSFVYEVLWTRLLSQVLGGSTAAFASMLSSFLLGIALGSAVASRFAKTRRSAALGFGIAQLGVGVLGWLAFRVADALPDLATAVGAHPAAPAAGAAAAGIILLPVTLCIGATFPFAVRLLTRDAEEAANVSGRVYAWNTLGSIVGAILAGFVLLPTLGLENTALVGTTTSLALAIAAAWLATPRRMFVVATAAVALATGLILGLPMPTRLLMNSAMSGTPIPGDLYYLGVGRSATVTVVENATGWQILTNGLPEAGVDRESLPNRRFQETAWLSLLPTAARPDTDSMLMIGLGAGQTLGATAGSVSKIDVIELEEEVVIANRKIPRTINPLDDPRVQLRVGDARGAITLSKARYDAIVSQPSHPWTSGASHLYTREFFELAHSKLEPGGIFVQWIGASFVDVELFGNLMASMTDVFEHVHVYRPLSPALVFVASDEPIDLAESAPIALAASADDFGRYGIHRVEDFYASWVLDTEGVRALAADKPRNTDDHNRLATRRLPPARSPNGRDTRLDALNDSFERVNPLISLPSDAFDRVATVRRMRWVGLQRQARQLAKSLPKAEQAAAGGWAELDGGRPRRAIKLFEESLKFDPGQGAARSGLIALGRGDRFEVEELTSAESAIAEAYSAVESENWEQLRSLEPRLAAIPGGDLLFAQAAMSRVRWRLQDDAPASARDAIAIIDVLLSRQRTADHYLMRALAAEKAGETVVAWATLEMIATRKSSRAIAQQAHALAVRLGDPPPGSMLTRRLAEQMKRRR